LSAGIYAAQVAQKSSAPAAKSESLFGFDLAREMN
jgi:hypothetical protein